MGPNRVGPNNVGPNIVGSGAWLFANRGWLPVPLAVLAVGVARWNPGWFCLGVVLVALGEVLRIWAVAWIGPKSRTRSDEVFALTKGGPYARSRNPLYVANIVLWVGVAFLAGQPVLGLVYLVTLFGYYTLIIKFEEENLESSLGGAYSTYRATVPRWLGAGDRGEAEGQPDWRGAVRSERSTMLAIAAVLSVVMGVLVTDALAESATTVNYP